MRSGYCRGPWSSLSPSKSSSWLELSRSNLVHNLARTKALCGDARVVAVVKANAYGAGAVGMAGVLSDIGVDAFAVATVAEGVLLRQQGIAGQIVCLTPFSLNEVEALRDADLTPMVFAAEAVACLEDHQTLDGKPWEVWVKVETGLNRFGVARDMAASFLRQLAVRPSIRIGAIYSTLTENPDVDPLQTARLLDVRRQIPELGDPPLSIASSNAILSSATSILDIVRPGIMLHGLLPSPQERLDKSRVDQIGLRPITTWKSRVLQTRTVPAGEQVGYGNRPPLEYGGLVATLPVGWSDGYAPDSQGSVLIRGQRCSVLAVSANATMVDANAAPEADVGDEAILVGRMGSLELKAAEYTGDTGAVYRMLAGIPPHIPRLWV